MENFYVQNIRMSGNDTSVFTAKIWTDCDEVRDWGFFAKLDDSPLQLQCKPRVGVDVRKKYMALDKIVNVEYYLYVTLPDGENLSGELSIWAQDGTERCIYQMPVRKIALLRQSIDSRIENINIQGDRYCLDGWCVSALPPAFTVKDSSGKNLEIEVRHHVRGDIFDEYPELTGQEFCGFNVFFSTAVRGKVTLEITNEMQKQHFTVNPAAYVRNQAGAGSTNKLRRAVSFLRQRGMKETWKKVTEKLTKKQKGTYKYWRLTHQPDAQALEAQKKTKFSYEPLFSVVVPLYRTNLEYLKALVGSIQQQTYGNWELCLSDGSGSESSLHSYLMQLVQADRRIKVASSKSQLNIAENTNEAVKLAAGDYLVFADHDDLLSLDALYECALACNQEERPEILYSDEDKISMDGKEYFMPHFKSDFNLDLLRSVNYISHLFVVSSELQKCVGFLRPEYNGAQDYDFILRCIEQSQAICHMDKVLYHWRAHKDSTAENPESKQYAFEAGKRALEDHYKRLGINAAVRMGQLPGIYHTKYIPEGEPLISILIPNKDHIEDLEKCISAIEERSTYKNYEYIIIENNSTEETTFAYYKKLERENPKAHVVYYKGGFNYSAINNFGAKHAKGDYFLLLNNDTEIINDDCIEEMLGFCMRSEVGIVGCRLLYEDDTIQHAGVIIGYGGLAGHAFAGAASNDPGYFGRIICAQDLSAVTAACLMTRREVFEEVGGLSEDLAVAFNDIDYCLKVRSTGKLVVYNPNAMLHHYESKSRGYENTPEKVERFNREIVLLDSKWPEIMKNGDPYYNRNLSLNRTDFALRVDK